MERLNPVVIKEAGLNPKIKVALDRIEEEYKVPKDQLMISAGAAVSLLLPPNYLRPITDVDILIDPDYAHLIPGLNPYRLDLRSVPWGLIYLNPIITIPPDKISPQIDLLLEMYHAHLPGENNDPLSGFIYRFPVKSAFENAQKVQGTRVMPPEFIVLYKLLQWRNGDYSGWDRTKRDVKDISLLMSNGLVSYNQVIYTITNHVPDVEAQQVLVERLNIALNCDDPTKIGTTEPSLLVQERQWSRPEISGQLEEVFKAFVTSQASCGRILKSGRLKIVQ